MVTSNFHTHTFFCDGNDSPEDMVLAAIDKGFTSLGFSGHCDMYLPSNDYSMSFENEPIYRAEIARLKAKYKDKIKIFCGVELDYYSHIPQGARYDYVIGSVHYVLKGENYIPIDDTPETLENAVEKFYGGDFDSISEDYFNTVADVVNATKCDIIGHFDLISKYFEISNRTESDRYLKAAESAVEKLIPYNKPFEINTGAISRGYRTTPYPSVAILKMIKRLGGKIAFSSDAHSKNYLDCRFREAVELAKSIGFTDYAVLCENGTEYLPL